MDGDGHEDLLLGAPGAVQEPPVPGTVFLWTSELAGKQSSDSADAIIEGVEASSGTGASMDGVGDVDGDGNADLLLGVPNLGWGSADFGFGAAHLLFGPIAGAVDPAEGLLFVGDRAMPLGVVGSVVAGLGDVDGAGLDDIAISGVGIESDGGGTYLVFGTDL